jgi:hypothetical protein
VKAEATVKAKGARTTTIVVEQEKPNTKLLWIAVESSLDDSSRPRASSK